MPDADAGGDESPGCREWVGAPFEEDLMVTDEWCLMLAVRSALGKKEAARDKPGHAFPLGLLHLSAQ